MKKSAIIIILALGVLQTQAQDYLISFAGIGGSTNVDSVQVSNLTQNTNLTLNGTDVLHLMGDVGIDQAIIQSNAGLRIYPNPMNEQGFFEFESASSDLATIVLCDITGKQVAHIQHMLPSGRHTFAISGLISGIYTLSIQSAAYVYSGKIVCTCINSGNPKINYVSTDLKSTAQDKLKSIQSLVQMQYNNGNQLLFKCFSGVYSTVIPLVPTQSQTVTSNFIACIDADNNNYATITINAQTWMAENLKVGVRIDGVQEQTNNGTIEKYCYDNDTNNCNIYGGLYEWNEMMQYITTPGVQGICPTGWHIPTDTEWTTLTNFLGGSSVAGGKMKSTGTIESGTGLWYSPNAGATNESGFTAVPAGLHIYNAGPFSNIGSFGFWWSSSEYYTSIAWRWILGYNSSIVSRDYDIKNYGFSVRCVRDESIPFTYGSTITINHVAGDVAPIDKTVTYGTVNSIPGEPTKCWITSNLGADHQATSVDDDTEPSAGWYWQFNRKQGYKHTGTVRTPNTTWIYPISENSNWIPTNDPCTLELGAGWRIPTDTEWTNVDASGDWTNWNGPWNSALKMHAAGYLSNIDGSLYHRGSNGSYWSNMQLNYTYSWFLSFFNSNSHMTNFAKSFGYSVRCVRDY